MKNLGKAKTIIWQKIIKDIELRIFKIDLKKYIWNFLKSEKWFYTMLLFFLLNLDYLFP